MKKSYLLASASIACLFVNMAFTTPEAKCTSVNDAPHKVKSITATAAFLENASTTIEADIKLTSTTGGSSYEFLVPKNTSETEPIADGTYNIEVTEVGPGTLHVERCASDIYGEPGMPTPFSFTGYVALDGSRLVITTIN